MLRGKPFPGPSHACLNLIKDEQDAPRIADSPQFSEEFCRRDHISALTKNRLHDNAGDLVRVDKVFKQPFEVLKAVHAAGIRLPVKEAAIAVRIG